MILRRIAIVAALVVGMLSFGQAARADQICARATVGDQTPTICVPLP